MCSQASPTRWIHQIGHPLASRVKVPGSKSITNRALIVSALARGNTVLHNALLSDDTEYLSNALSALGFKLEVDSLINKISIKGLNGTIPSSSGDLFLGNAGTAVRFLTAMLTLGNGRYSVDGVQRMRQRPMGSLIKAMNNLGAKISGTEVNYDSTVIQSRICPPVHIEASGLDGGETRIRGDISSQFISAILMIAPYAKGKTKIWVDKPINSKPYIELTIRIMDDFEVQVERDHYSNFCIHPQQYTSPGDYTIESDASSASYFFAAPAILGGWVEVQDIACSSIQGDMRFLDILKEMGCKVRENNNSVRVTSSSKIKGIDIDMSDISDTSLTLAVIAPFADGPTRIRGIASSRMKETDRISAICTELKRLGVKIEEHDDGMTVFPCSEFRQAEIKTYNDHRMAMAFSILGLKIPGIRIENPSCVSKTFPNFFDILNNLI